MSLVIVNKDCIVGDRLGLSHDFYMSSSTVEKKKVHHYEHFGVACGRIGSYIDKDNAADLIGSIIIFSAHSAMYRALDTIEHKQKEHLKNAMTKLMNVALNCYIDNGETFLMVSKYHTLSVCDGWILFYPDDIEKNPLHVVGSSSNAAMVLLASGFDHFETIRQLGKIDPFIGNGFDYVDRDLLEPQISYSYIVALTNERFSKHLQEESKYDELVALGLLFLTYGKVLNACLKRNKREGICEDKNLSTPKIGCGDGLVKIVKRLLETTFHGYRESDKQDAELRDILLGKIETLRSLSL